MKILKGIVWFFQRIIWLAVDVLALVIAAGIVIHYRAVNQAGKIRRFLN